MTPQDYTIADILNVFDTIQEMDKYFPHLECDIYSQLSEEDIY